ncbi:MAG: SCP-like extracellular [Firmicutes bacterium]|nr:SCP-like extracellular [Bacillota bacterium]
MLNSTLKTKLLTSIITFSILSTALTTAVNASQIIYRAPYSAYQQLTSNSGSLVNVRYTIPRYRYTRQSNLYTIPASTSTTPAQTTTTTTQTTTTTNSGNYSSEEQQALALLNADRAANGLPSLRVNAQLTALAESYAKDMINRNYFAHTNPEGKSPFDRMRQANISYLYAGENLAIDRSVSGAETAFMGSSGHRANILNSHYTEVGIGVVHSSTGSVYVVQEFIGK